MKIYHTETQADYDSLMVELEKQGVKWYLTTNPTEANHWPEFESQTGIKLQDGILTYHGVEYFERVNPETPIIKYTAKKETQLPEWANWVARDENGELWAFENKPFKMIRLGIWVDNECGSERVEETDVTFEGILWTHDEPTKIKRGLEAGGISVEELNCITNAKAHGYDEIPEVVDKTEPVYVDKDGAEITVGETTSISFEEAMALVENKVDDIADKRYETPDIINEPNHYKGKHGIETIDVIRNFGSDDMVAGFYWGNAIKYMTRYRSKNGLEDLKKARKNLDWLIEHTEG